MRYSLRITTIILILVVLAVNLPAQETMTNPYEILRKHYDAIGGLDNLQSERTTYYEGSISIVGTGLEGTAKMWTAYPLRQRQETDLTIIKQVTGDNGEFSWMVDANGKLIIQKDEQTLNIRLKRIRCRTHLLTNRP